MALASLPIKPLHPLPPSWEKNHPLKISWGLTGLWGVGGGVTQKPWGAYKGMIPKINLIFVHADAGMLSTKTTVLTNFNMTLVQGLY